VIQRLARIPSNIAIVASLALCVPVIAAWAYSHHQRWVRQIVRDHGDFRLVIASDRGVLVIGETHHFEEWRIPYWKLLLLFASPAAIPTHRQFRRLLSESRAGLCPKCGYDLRATPDRCPECGSVSNAPK
jgi:hypothetical protein